MNHRRFRIPVIVASILIGVGLGYLAFSPVEEDTPSMATDQEITDAGDRDGEFILEVSDEAADDPLASQLLADSGLDDVIDLINDEYALPRDVMIYYENDPDEAYFDPGQRLIVLSPTLFADIADLLESSYGNRDDAEYAASSNLLVIALHEVAHAMISELAIPYTGREEDAADEFAVLTTVELLDDPVATLETSDFFDAASGPLDAFAFYDEHSLDQQRFFAMRCLIYGSDPDEFEQELDGLDLEEYRFDSCEEDYERALTSWETLLDPHYE